MKTTARRAAWEDSSPAVPEGDRRVSPRCGAGVTLVGVALWVLAPTMASVAGAFLPDAATVRSAGFVSPGFEVAWTHALRGLALALGTGGALLLVLSQWDVRTPRPMRRLAWLPPALLGGAGFLLYLWLAYPPNMFPTNARIHWVDLFYERSENFVYTLVKLHALFYEFPHLFQAVFGALNVLLVYLIGQALFSKRWIAAGMAISFLVSEHVLMFADTREDVVINVTALLVAYLSYLRRQRLMLGVAMFVLFLGRPQFVTFVAAFVMTEAVFHLSRRDGGSIGGRIAALARDRFVVGNIVTFTVLLVGWQLSLWASGNHWLLRDGRLIGLESLERGVVDGFAIHSFSGAYVLHAVWVYPLLFVAANLVVAGHWRHLTRDMRKNIALGWAVVLLNLLFLEYEPVQGYNVRYIVYTLPLVLVTGWAVFAVPLPRALRSVPTGVLATILALSTVTTHAQGVRERRNLDDDAMTSLYPYRERMREAVGDRPVATTLTSWRAHNYLSYLLRMDYRELTVVGPADVQRGVALVTNDLAGVPGHEVLFRPPRSSDAHVYIVAVRGE